MSPSRVIGTSLVVSIAASLALVVFYLVGDSVRVEGVLLAGALGGLGVAIVVWARLLRSPTVVEERDELESEDQSLGLAEASDITRRSALTKLAAGAAVTLGSALAIPALTLGPRPGESLFRTRWTRGARVVDFEDNPVRPEDLTLQSVLTVFPEGFAGESDSQTILIRVEPDLLSLPENREQWAPDGLVGYSKICTHAGCPVGLYRAEAHELLCPCHQSTFDVLTGAVPVFGPAARPLPQLPLGVDEDGFLIALGDFTEPVGPSFWNMTRGDA